MKLAVLATAMIALSACAARPRMCVAPSDCGSVAACVAGRCQPAEGAPAISAARRLVVAPLDVAYVGRFEAPRGGALPAIFTLGRAGLDAVLFVRFSVPLPPDATVVEAYLLLTRSKAVDVDPTPISLHAARIVDAWDGRSTSWASQPRTEELRSPTTTVLAGGRTRVRLDVRDLVRRWRAHEKSEHGIAVVAENTSATGMAFALVPGQPDAELRTSQWISGVAPTGAPAVDARGAVSPVVDPGTDPGRAEQAGLLALELYIK